MLRLNLTAVLLLTLLPANGLLANVGVFTGFGHSVELTKTEDVQMVSEEVMIIPGRGRFLFDGSVPGMDNVEYDCKFELKNLKDKPITIKVGFPLNSQFLRPPYKNKAKAAELVARYKFIAQDETQQYSLSYAPGDRTKKLKNLFIWEMTFSPNESKELRVSYSMPISMTLASTGKDRLTGGHSKTWYRNLEGCMLEYFGYVTETGKSWAGSIEKATFKVYVKGFEKYLINRPFLEGLTEKNAAETRKKYPVSHPALARLAEPEGWEMDEEGILQVSYTNFVPKENILFRYYIIPYPTTIPDFERWIAKFSAQNFQKDDYQDLLDILKAFNGEKTANKRIKTFLDNQVWYERTPLKKVPDEVLVRLETLIKE